MITSEISNEVVENSNEIDDDTVEEKTSTSEINSNSSNSSDVDSEISLSEKIVLESNEKRLRKRMSSLQNSIMNLKEQLKTEKELWKEDIERLRSYQKLQQQELHCACPAHQTKSLEITKIDYASRCSSLYSLFGYESNFYNIPKYCDELLRTQSIKQLLDLHNYKRKLAETENMCNVELLKVKQSLDDLKNLQNIASEWGKGENKPAPLIGKENEITLHMVEDNNNVVAEKE